MTTHHSPLRAGSSIAILMFDWIVFAISLVHFHYWVPATIFGALATAATIAYIERNAGTALKPLLLRSILGALVVAVPLPLVGTVVALVFLSWTAIANHREQTHRNSPHLTHSTEQPLRS